MDPEDNGRPDTARFRVGRAAVEGRGTEPSGVSRAPGAPYVDLTEFPIVRTTLPELVDAPIIVAIFAGLRRAEERGVPYVHIADLSAVDSIETAGAINAVRTESAANEVRGPSNCTASAVIAPSVFLRSVVRAAFAFARRGIDRQVFSTRSRANEWAHARVAATTDPSRDTK